LFIGKRITYLTMFKGEFREYMYYINIVVWDGKGVGGGGGKG